VSLFLDENLSAKLVDRLRPIFPGVQHVDLAGLRGQTDHAVWNFARDHGLAIVSKDNDFRQLAFLHGPPPKVI
jgi:predicted nuclease of predicted toxin-antitoxin system